MGGGRTDSGCGVREGERRCEVAFDSAAPAASSPPRSSPPFVSTDRLARTGGLELVEGMLMGETLC